MAVEFKDYYQILGVSRTANEDEIRKAFRKLARQYHPDVARNKTNAEEKFKEVNEAYEVLSDPDKRKKYDTLGADWKRGAEFRPPSGGNQHRTWRSSGAEGGADGFEFHFGGTGFSDFFEQVFGSRGNRSAGFDPKAFQDENDFSQRGRDVEADLLVTLEEAFRGSIRSISFRRTVACEKCGGTGHVRQQTCSVCAGAGHVSKTETHKVKVPPGVREGQRLRLAGRGEAGAGEGPAGDLFLRVRLAKHPDFRVEENDLHYELELAPWEAVLGTKVPVPTLEGRVDIKIPPGTQNSQRLRVRGKGLLIGGNGRGDLFVVVRVQVPDKIGERERNLWEQLARESNFHPRS